MFDEQQELSLQGGKNSPEINDPPLRVLRRITYESVEELKQLERLAGERGVDLEPSVYLVPEAIVRGVVQMHAEHLSVLSNAPNKHPRWHVNVSQLPHKGIVRKLGKTKFAFTQQAHACLTLMDEADVDAFADAVFACLGSDAVAEVNMPDIQRYAREKYEAGDAEWRAFVDGGDPKHQKDWGKWLRRV